MAAFRAFDLFLGHNSANFCESPLESVKLCEMPFLLPDMSCYLVNMYTATNTMQMRMHVVHTKKMKLSICTPSVGWLIC